MKSFLRWAGSKRQAIDVLKTYYRSENLRYVEPFVGSACLFFHLQPKQAILGDLNSDLINVYRCIKASSIKVYESYSKYPISKEQYYKVRSLDAAILSDYEKAGRFIYLNRFCFNGLYRTNLSGKFNVPYGAGKTGNLPTYRELLNYREILKSAKLITGDFSKVLDKVQFGDFVYLDPPYSVKNRRVFKEYDGSIFSESDLVRLRSYLIHMDDKSIPFLVSYSMSEEAEILSEGFSTATTEVRRNIAGFAGARKKEKEILITNI